MLQTIEICFARIIRPGRGRVQRRDDSVKRASYLNSWNGAVPRPPTAVRIRLPGAMPASVSLPPDICAYHQLFEQENEERPSDQRTHDDGW